MSVSAAFAAPPYFGEVALKTLHLLRHAKSSWDDPALDDHDRPLSKRGRGAAKLIAEHMARANIAPDVVLCSTALRARETLAPIAKRLKPARVLFSAGIYESPERRLWQQLWRLPEEAETALMIGHSPGVHELALALADAESLQKLPAAGGKFPTGALVSFAFRGAWKDLRPASAELLSFVRPKDLA